MGVWSCLIKEFIQFLSISKGSSTETKSQLFRIIDRNYISQEEFKTLSEKSDQLTNKIGALMAYLKKSSYKGIKYK